MMKSSHPFNKVEVREMLEHLIEPMIDRQSDYDSHQCTQLSKDLSRLIKDAMKTLNYDRYKYVIQVVLGQSNEENLMMTCRCLWDIDQDNYVSYVYSNRKVFCAVTVFALFYYWRKSKERIRERKKEKNQPRHVYNIKINTQTYGEIQWQTKQYSNEYLQERTKDRSKRIWLQWNSYRKMRRSRKTMTTMMKN